MTREEIYNLPKCAGIYCIRNTINNDCFIGKATKIQKQIKFHWNSWNNPIYINNSLYTAFSEYGIENFKITILTTFSDALSFRTKQQLDTLEEKFIEEYKPAYNNNETLEVILSDDKQIKAKNLETNIVIITDSIDSLSAQINISAYTIKRCLDKQQIIANKIWIFAYYNEEFPRTPKFGTWQYDELAQLETREAEIIKYIQANPNCSYGEISQNYKLSKKEFYNLYEKISKRKELPL